jgi:hypothetical protein
MTFFGKLRHWFTPHHTNNFRAKLLHNTGIVAVIAILLTGNLFIRLLDDPSLHILGFTSSITIDEIVRATNEQRVGAGLEPLSYSEKLADAARRKAANMFEENYWAHNSPSGKSPWVWIKAAGYNYVYAGENLAKDFGDTSRLMSAWMASPTHRDNVINSKYKEIGLAVVPGSILGQETVLVVQLFGTPNSGSVPAASPAVPNQAKAETPAPQVVAEVQGREVAEMVPSDVEILQLEPAKSPVAIAPAKFNKFSLARTLNLATTALFILALVVDLYLAESRKLSRRVGNNWAHILFINLILLVTVIVNAGKIM